MSIDVQKKNEAQLDLVSTTALAPNWPFGSRGPRQPIVIGRLMMGDDHFPLPLRWGSLLCGSFPELRGFARCRVVMRHRVWRALVGKGPQRVCRCLAAGGQKDD